MYLSSGCECVYVFILIINISQFNLIHSHKKNDTCVKLKTINNMCDASCTYQLMKKTDVLAKNA